jgi:hypothetical protein
MLTKYFAAVVAVAAALCTDSVRAELSDAHCVNFADTITAIAEAHQREVPMAAVLATFDALDAKARAMITAITLNIYDGPRYSMPKHQRSEVAKWRDEAHVVCLRIAIAVGTEPLED